MGCSFDLPCRRNLKELTASFFLDRNLFLLLYFDRNLLCYQCHQALRDMRWCECCWLDPGLSRKSLPQGSWNEGHEMD